MAAQITITQLPTAGALTGQELVPIVQNGVTVQTTTGAISTGSSGSVTSVAVSSANGFSGSVADPTGAANITLSTTVTGMLKGSGTGLATATANTDYQAPIALTTTGSSGAATFDGSTLNIPQYSGGGGGSGTVTSVSVTSANGFQGSVANATTTPAITVSTNVTGILKGDGTGMSAASAGTDYQAPITLTTTGSSGAATFVGNTLNIPQYSGGGGSGTVTSVAATVPAFLSVTGSPITTSGTLAISYSGTALPIANGGTGQTTAAAAITALTGTQTSGRYLRSDGTNATLSAIVAADVPTLNQNTTGTAANVTGTVAVANGGTALTAAPSNGQLLIGNGTGYTLSTLTAGSNVTITNTAGGISIASTAGGTGTVTSVAATVPAFLSVTGSPITTSGTLALSYSGTALPIANGGTGQTSFTANYIPYGSFSTSASLQFDGTTMRVGANALLGGTTNPILGVTGAANGYIQSYIYNGTNGASSSADFVAYPNNGTDAHGWVDVGITSQTYADAAYSITGANESYLFGSAPSGAGSTGNLVYATDDTGSANSHQWYVGGFAQSKSAWKMQLTTTGLQLANALGVAYGGTGLTAGTSGGVLYYSSSSALASSAALTQYGVVYGGGAGAAPASTAAGTTGQVLTATTGGAPTWAAAATGTVTSVSFTGGIISVATATTTPALTVAGTSGGIPYFSSASTWTSSGVLAASALVVGGGAGAAPSTITTGTGVVTALGINTGSSGAVVTQGAAIISATTIRDSAGTGYAIGYRQMPQNNQTTATTYTLVLADDGKHIYLTGGTTNTLTVPTNASVAFTIGTVITVVNNNSGICTITGPTSGLQLANGALATTRSLATKGMATMIKVGTDLWYVSGAGVT